MLPAVRVLQKLYSNNPKNTSIPGFGFRSPMLEQSVQDNLSDEAAAVGVYFRTRVERRAASKIATVGVTAFSRASRVTWIKYFSKGIVRFIPIVGYGMLAYDLYNLGDDLDLY